MMVVSAVMMIIVRSVRLQIRQLVLLVLQMQLRVTFLLCHLSKYVDDLNQAKGVECRIMLLRQPQRPLLPIGHLLALAHLLVQKVLGDLSQTRLVRSYAHFAVVGLSVDEVGEELVEFHRREVPRKDVQVALEREADAERIFVRKYICQDIVKQRIGGQRDEINQERRAFVTKLQQGRAHAVELRHGRSPLRVHAHDRPAYQLA